MSLSSAKTPNLQPEEVQSFDKLPNGFRIHQYFQRYIRTQYTFAGSIMINLSLMINYSQFKMHNSDRKQWFLQAGFYFTLFCIILLVAKLHAEYHYRIQTESTSLTQTILALLLKTGILLLRPYPFLQVDQGDVTMDYRLIYQNQYHPVNNILTVLGLAQTFMIFQMIFNSSKLKNDRSDRICQMFDMRASNMYIIRAWFKRNYILRLFIIFFIWSLICTECFRIAQYRYNHRIKSLQNAFWLTFSSMFCIGFGDVFPQTNFGNWVAFFSMYTGLVFIYFLITEIQNFLRLNSHQRRALALSISLERKSQIKLVASKFIRQSLWRVWRNYKNKQYGIYMKPSLKESQLRKRIRDLRISSRNFRGVETVYNEFLHNFQRTQGSIDNLIFNNDQLANELLGLLTGNEITRIMSKRGTFKAYTEIEQITQIQSIESPNILETIPTFQSFERLED